MRTHSVYSLPSALSFMLSKLMNRSHTKIFCISSAILICVGCGEKRQNGAGPYDAIIAEAIPQIEKMVGLTFKAPPQIESRTREQVRAFVLSQVTDTQAQRQIAGMEAAYKAFGLIPDTLKLQQFLVDLLEEQIEGYYDPKTKVLYIVEGAPKKSIQMTVSHELIHALQDQYIDIDSVQRSTEDNDRRTATQAVFEGQAIYEQLASISGKAAALPGGWERIRQLIRNNRSAMPIYSAAPLVIQETLLFPYLSGAEFVKNYKERTKGGVPFQELPTSTEQILHAQAYFGTRDEPTDVSFALPPGIAPIYQNTLGEFETRIFLYHYLEAQEDAVRGATGWDGDRYVVFNTNGGHAIAWATVWDSNEDAAEFYTLMQRVTDVRKKRQPTRTVTVSTGEMNGRPIVFYLDVPAGVNPDIMTLNVVRLGTN
jgi:hypothetical protein